MNDPLAMQVGQRRQHLDRKLNVRSDDDQPVKIEKIMWVGGQTS